MLILRHVQPIKREFNHNLFLENSHHITVFFRKGPKRAPVFVTFKISVFYLSIFKFKRVSVPGVASKTRLRTDTIHFSSFALNLC